MATIAGYDVSLKDGYPICSNNQQTWVYIISASDELPSPQISHFEFQICHDHNVLRVSKNGQEVNASEASTINVQIYEPPNADSACLYVPVTPPDYPIRIIKWDSLSNADVQFPPEQSSPIGEYNFVLEGCYETGDVNISIKAADHEGGCNNGTIQGPTCELIPPPRGIDFSNITDIDIIE